MVYAMTFVFDNSFQEVYKIDVSTYASNLKRLENGATFLSTGDSYLNIRDVTEIKFKQLS